jgi:hypothetical protein
MDHVTHVSLPERSFTPLLTTKHSNNNVSWQDSFRQATEHHQKFQKKEKRKNPEKRKNGKIQKKGKTEKTIKI